MRKSPWEGEEFSRSYGERKDWAIAAAVMAVLVLLVAVHA